MCAHECRSVLLGGLRFEAGGSPRALPAALSGLGKALRSLVFTLNPFLQLGTV
jgi:hypothetical protein